MSTLYDLLLLGNITVDENYCIDEWPAIGTSNEFQSVKVSIGGIGNIIEAIKNSELKLRIETVVGNDNNGKLVTDYLTNNSLDFILHRSNEPTSKALILSSRVSNERTSFVNWGCAGTPLMRSCLKTKWTHISYLDTSIIENLKSIRANSNVVSADLCLSDPSSDVIIKVLNQLSCLDYLFISESEIKPLLTSHDFIPEILKLIKSYKLKCCIFHTKVKTFIVMDDWCSEVDNKNILLDNVNVLGAGDVYCANFILAKLTDVTDTEAALLAHQGASQFIANND